MSEINMTPLVDVMLVLLIVFMITLPAINHAIKIDLPRANAQASSTKPEVVSISIKENGQIYWNQEAVDDAQLKKKMTAAAQQQPELHLRADRNTRYERVAQVMAGAQQQGLNKLGFITEPDHP
ncbi:MAG: biopolymer transporter ExbD [Ottowia sp.]|nr:biopolymer transporter ExbD [Ottowia sp.]